jgi:predicted unusual protein kinase regulating ubiquinone biosynthesis (AarF/ABC1/UbiB family)
MIKMSKEEFDRLMETSPNVPDKIITQFKYNFKSSDIFDKIVKPEICDILVPTNDYRNPWFNDENRAKQVGENIKLKLEKQNKIKKTNEYNNRIIYEFISVFTSLNNRDPMESEIIDNLKDRIDTETIKKILNENKSSLSVNINTDSGENSV